LLPLANYLLFNYNKTAKKFDIVIGVGWPDQPVRDVYKSFDVNRIHRIESQVQPSSVISRFVIHSIRRRRFEYLAHKIGD